MRQATVRWIIFLAALLAVGPAASWLLHPMRAIDGSSASTPLLCTDPAQGLLRALLAYAIALAMGLLACRIAGFRSALSSVGLVLVWIAWRTADTDRLIRAAGSGAPLKKLAIEGAIFGLAGLLIAVLLALFGRVAESHEEHDLGTGSLRARLLGSDRGPGSAPLVIIVALIAGAAAGWLVAATPMKGQAVFAAIFAGIAIAAAGRLADFRTPLAILFVPLAVLAIVSPLIALYATKGSILAASYAQTIIPLANITPLDWIAGGFLGIPLGAAWTSSMIEKRLPA
jgi:hypothetical protein